MNRPQFNAKKAIEVATYFLSKSPKQSEYHLLIIKLMYLAERKAFQKWGRLITWDRFVSMDHGPVPSQTFNRINGSVRDDEWENYISDIQDHRVKLRKQPDVSELSEAEMELLDEIFHTFSEDYRAKYGDDFRWKVVDYTHTLPEWRDPHGSTFPIELEDILKADKKSKEEIQQISEELEAVAAIDNLLASV